MRLVLASVAALLAAPALAQPAGLKELLDAADQNNVDRRVSAELVTRAAADYQAAWTSLLPSLTAQGSWTHNEYEVKFQTGPTTTLVIQPFDQLDGVVRVDLPLVDTTRWMRMLAADLAQGSAGQREASMRDVVRRQVVSGWYGYAAALAVRESAKKSAAVSEEQAKLMEIREKAGAVTELELLRARAEVQRTRQVVADTDALVNTTRRMLRTVSGVEPAAEASLPTDDLRPEAGFEELEQRVEGLPGVKAADKDLEVAQKLALAAKLALVPTLGAQFTERLTNATSFSGKSSSYLAGVNLVWRIDVPTFHNMKAQQANASTAALGAERTRLQARDQVYGDWQKLTTARIKVEAALAQVQAARRAAQVARDRYAVGASTQVDVIQAERDLFSAEVSQISARTELASARTSLHLSAGLPLFGE